MVVRTADVRDGKEPAIDRRLRRSRDRRVLVQREVSAPPMIVGKVLLEVSTSRALIPHDHVVKALAPHRPGHAFNERILPGRPRRRQYVFDLHRSRGLAELRSVNRIAVSQDESGGARPRPGFAELLRGPRRGGFGVWRWRTAS